MIKIVPHFMKVRNGDGKFVDYLVIKGAPGDIENLSYFTTSETGDSEELVMTQKGVTDIHDKLLSGEMMVGSADYSNFAVYAERAANDADGNPIATTYAKNAHIEGELFSGSDILEEAVRLIGDGTKSFIAHRYFTVTHDDLGNEDIKGLPAGVVGGYATFIVHNQGVTVWVWGIFNSAVHYNRYNGSSWTGWREIVDSSNTDRTKVERATKDAKGNVIDTTYATKTALTDGTIVPKKATTATKADTATEAERVNGEAATAQAFRHVWFSDSGIEAKRVYDDEFKYDPKSHTLTVGSITGNAATATKATKADTATTADKLSSESFKTATATCTAKSGNATLPDSITSGFYLVNFSATGDYIKYSGMLYLNTSGVYTVCMGKYHMEIGMTNKTIELKYDQSGVCAVGGTITFYKISS